MTKEYFAVCRRGTLNNPILGPPIFTPTVSPSIEELFEFFDNFIGSVGFYGYIYSIFRNSSNEWETTLEKSIIYQPSKYLQ